MSRVSTVAICHDGRRPPVEPSMRAYQHVRDRRSRRRGMSVVYSPSVDVRNSHGRRRRRCGGHRLRDVTDDSAVADASRAARQPLQHCSTFTIRQSTSLPPLRARPARHRRELPHVT